VHRASRKNRFGIDGALQHVHSSIALRSARAAHRANRRAVCPRPSAVLAAVGRPRSTPVCHCTRPHLLVSPSYLTARALALRVLPFGVSAHPFRDGGRAGVWGLDGVLATFAENVWQRNGTAVRDGARWFRGSRALVDVVGSQWRYTHTLPALRYRNCRARFPLPLSFPFLACCQTRFVRGSRALRARDDGMPSRAYFGTLPARRAAFCGQRVVNMCGRGLRGAGATVCAAHFTRS
jgi:hypothetical protein